MRLNCLITGCELIIEDRVYHGDLHAIDDENLVFNAVVDHNGQPRVTHNVDTDELMTSAKCCVFVRDDDLWERRGVVLFKREHAQFNEAATKRAFSWEIR